MIVKVLSSYINPGGLRPCRFITVEDSESMDTQADPPPQPLPPCIHGLLLQSCLLPALASYLRNDSGRLSYIIYYYTCGLALAVTIFI